MELGMLQTAYMDRGRRATIEPGSVSVVGSMISAAGCTDHYPSLRAAVPGGSTAGIRVISW
jgi:hypothetical protein